MRRIDEQREVREKKLHLLEHAGVSVYPARSNRTHTIAEATSGFMTLKQRETSVTLVGRIQRMREHGKSFFISFSDAFGSFQAYVKLDELGEESYTLWKSVLDIGDFCAFTGTLFTTKKNEKTILVKTVSMLAKSLRPVPGEYYGLEDAETRYRKRYLDFLLHPERRALFYKKARFWSSIRNFLLHAGFLEVETPVLEAVPGGAETEPFQTHHTALDQDFFLRISLELPLKRLLVGGFEKVFEIGRIFRNEGISSEHLQDYTQMECYWSYADYEAMMKFITSLYRTTIQETFGTLTITSSGHRAEWGSAWKHYDYVALFEKHVGLSLRKASTDALRKKMKSLKLDLKRTEGRGRAIDALYKKCVRPKLLDPGFLMDPPVDVEPLAKRKVNAPDRVERFQVVAYGTELGKGFSELNDPIDQRRRFEEQMQLRASGDAQAQRIDDEYLEAMEYGMPPAAGFGLSERFFAVLSDVSVREASLFPLMKNTRHA